MNLTELNFIVFLSNYVIPENTPVLYTRSKLECAAITNYTHHQSFFYHRKTRVCITLPYTIYSTQNLVNHDGFQYSVKEAPICGPVPTFDLAVFNSVTVETSGIYRANYICPSAYFTTNTEPFSYCETSTQSWTPLQLNCSVVSSCGDIQKCNPSYVDGEYWLYPDIYNNSRVKIYCHGLSSSQPSEYITLPKINVASYPEGEYTSSCSISTFGDRWGETNFNKIRINIKTTEVTTDDYTFTTQVNGIHQPFGHAEACSNIASYDTCPKQGYALVDVTETGFKFNPLTNWKLGGWQSLCDIIELSNVRFVGQGDGYCGGCFPDGAIKLDRDLTAIPALSTAVIPQCGTSS
ncbi:A disintegrin and metalloproteinase with thrombospondin motifs gon-1 [Patella vulgata]|uniref:A disintegrin and metalloproteinase with thrombospondin motifs gon-1 n=1 Tax=Patella vulgata TaxID=6465 RepID=UPI0024A9F4B6|nr:A disintegrin and metalloproteinase with thrombospondin motifs gon-1 [Patella vulgata]